MEAFRRSVDLGRDGKDASGKLCVWDADGDYDGNEQCTMHSVHP